MNFRKIYLLLLIVSLTALSCGKEPIFTEMKTSRLRIILKGTLESEEGLVSDSGYVTLFTYSKNNAAAATAIEDSVNSNDSVDEIKAPAEDLSPSTLMLDIAEIRLGGKKISNYRQVFEIPLDDSHSFFNGKGIELKTDDPGDGYYDSVQIYFRKMIFDSAKVYQSTGSGFSYEKDLQVIFHENTRNGLDFNQLMVNSYWDSLRLESGEIIRVFPMHIPIIGGLTYNRGNNETVVEIRLVIKNFIKKYEYDYYEGGVYKVCHYYAPSDWLRDVRAGENDIGRNLHGVAKAYVPGQTGILTGTATSGRYVVAIPENEQVADYTLPNDGVTIRSQVKGDLPLPPSYPGSYIDATLEYYLKNEKYKNDWNKERQDILDDNTSFPACSTDSLCKYESFWDRYEADVDGFKIAPYIAFSNGNYTFQNMAPGRYKIYISSASLGYGKLFNTDVVQLNVLGGTETTPAVVNAGSITTVNQ